MFECKKCGKCCTLFHLFPKDNELRIMLDSGDGTCKYFDRASRLCSIYESRPIICNHAKYYEQYLKDRLTREDYDVFMKLFCDRIRGDDIH